MREHTITPNWTDLVQLSSQIEASENIYLKDTWFTPDLDENLSKTPSHDLSVAPGNNNNTLMPSHYILHTQESMASKRSPFSEMIDHTASKGVRNTSNVKKVCFAQQSSNTPSGMPYHEGKKG